MGLRIEISDDKGRLEKQAAALEWQPTRDTREEDREIHRYALGQVRGKLDRLRR